MATSRYGGPAIKIKKKDLGSSKEHPEVIPELLKCQNDINALNEKCKEEIEGLKENWSIGLNALFEYRTRKTKRIPHFWFKIIDNHPVLTLLVDDEDEDCLQYVTNIDVEYFKGSVSGSQIHFYFEENNPFFDNQVLTKIFFVDTNGRRQTTNTPIMWKNDHNVCQKENMDPKPTCSQDTEYVEYRSFFDWYRDNESPQSYVIADIFKDEIWRNPLQYYFSSYDEMSERESEGAENNDTEYD